MIFLEDWVMAFLSGVCAYEAADYGEYDTVSDVVESKVHQCQQNSDA